MRSKLADLARQGALRIAINTGNRALVQVDGEDLTGVSPALAKRLAAEIGVAMLPVIYDGAGKVFADADQDRWDVAFLAIDEKRAQKVAFTRPYIIIEATYAVRADTDLQFIEEVDSVGTRVLTSTGSAYDMHLSKTLNNAVLERAGTPPESFADFRDGRCDAVAGVRESLVDFFGDDPSVRILPGVLASVRQAMVLSSRDDPSIAALDDFVRRAIDEGFVAAAT
ncbi:transporter substrate-binding domain-containing protein [Sulfitobacter sp. F26204]|uniref:transporter substrate-binding domain-containing protein n=1 Tax=Sulfitobacter sp. F26204 TaxID=2996014 RepID=UPI00225E6983|nr:transporter substrate-binding domain-containing protein [Sulfitobacter sp. F26204]MCX7560286.1 transporter substrate-binding domain-containing protein [Sulfitobacter sp. F26204]